MKKSLKGEQSTAKSLMSFSPSTYNNYHLISLKKNFLHLILLRCHIFGALYINLHGFIFLFINQFFYETFEIVIAVLPCLYGGGGTGNISGEWRYRSAQRL